MATGGDNFSYSTGSEEFYDIVCDPCQDDGVMHKAVGMCIDCKDHLCQSCYDGHKISKLSRKHELLDKKTMLQTHVSVTKDKCTEKCAVHDEEVIKYYCINHSYLGCSVCITLDHRTCDGVKYIPHAAKYPTNNEEYKQVESQLISVMNTSKKVTKDNMQKTESLKKDCSKAISMVQIFRKEINEAIDKLETDLLQQCETIMSDETAKLSQIIDTFKSTQRELHALVDTKEIYQNNKQNCHLYTLMMKLKHKLKLAQDGILQAEKQQSHIYSHIQFVANKESLNTMKLPETLGKIISSIARSEKTKTCVNQKRQITSLQKGVTQRMVRAEHIQNINVKHKNDKGESDITGLVVLPDKRLLTVDYYSNENVKLVDIKRGKVIACLTLSSNPHDVAKVTDCHVAITLPNDEKVAMVNVTATGLNVDRKMDVNGECYGVDCRDGKLAVSFCTPNKVQILTMQGSVLCTITIDQQGQKLFSNPEYVIFGQDNTSLYVSNRDNDNVIHVKLDGTVVGIYSDNELRHPMALLIDNSGHIYVCGSGSQNIHRITPDCRKVQVLLAEANDLIWPRSISYSETNCMVYVGMIDYDVIKEYKVILSSK